MRYRPHIDGLRAVAVLSVVAFHAGVPGMSGGFTGVDVFFVISGYLITGLLVSEIERNGRISLGKFYERRVRRLAPALVVVLGATLILGGVFLTPVGGEQQALAASTISAIFFSSNLYFWQTTGYFHGPAELQPLLHTWSLAVEEQFYLLWPIGLLMLVWLGSRGRWSFQNLLRVLLLVLFVVSLALAVVATHSRPGLAFFSMPTRAWEFAAGGLVFTLGRNVKLGSLCLTAIALLGVASLVVAVTCYSAATAFPGAAALLPVLGAAAIILAGDLDEKNIVARALSLRVLVFVGLISYPLYLWHWPLLAFARVHTLGQIEFWQTSTVCVLSFLLAWLTYSFVEQPVRRSSAEGLADRARTMKLAGASCTMLLLASIALGAHAQFVWPRDTENKKLQLAIGATNNQRPSCAQPRPFSGELIASSECDEKGSNVDLMIWVWGDSHAGHLFPGTGQLRRQLGASVKLRFMAECPPILGFSPLLVGIDRSTGCEEFNRSVADEIGRSAIARKKVVMSARWPAYISNSSGRQAAASGLVETLGELERMGVDVVLVAPGPSLPHRAPACLARRPLAQCSANRVAVESWRADAMSILSGALPAQGSFKLFDPMTALCDTTLCSPMPAASILYSDSHHLSDYGASVVMRSLIRDSMGPAPLIVLQQRLGQGEFAR